MKLTNHPEVTMEPARFFLFLNGKDFISIASNSYKIQIKSKGSILVNKFEFEKATVSIYQATYGNEYCESYKADIDLEPDLIRCIDDSTNECVLTIYKPKRNHIEDIKLLEYQWEKTAAGLFAFTEIDKTIDGILESAYGKIKSKTNPSKTLLSVISINIPK